MSILLKIQKRNEIFSKRASWIFSFLAFSKRPNRLLGWSNSHSPCSSQIHPDAFQAHCVVQYTIVIFFFRKKNLFSAMHAWFKDIIFTFLLKCILYVRICFCFLILHFNVWLIAIRDCIFWISTKDSFSVYCYFIIIKGNFWLSSLTKWPRLIKRAHVAVKKFK